MRKIFLIVLIAFVSFEAGAQGNEKSKNKDKGKKPQFEEVAEPARMPAPPIDTMQPQNKGQQIKAVNEKYRNLRRRVEQNNSLSADQKKQQLEELNKQRLAEINLINENFKQSKQKKDKVKGQKEKVKGKKVKIDDED